MTNTDPCRPILPLAALCMAAAISVGATPNARADDLSANLDMIRTQVEARIMSLPPDQRILVANAIAAHAPTDARKMAKEYLTSQGTPPDGAFAKFETVVGQISKRAVASMAKNSIAGGLVPNGERASPRTQQIAAVVEARGGDIMVDLRGDGLIQMQLPRAWAKGARQTIARKVIGVTTGQVQSIVGSVLPAREATAAKASIVDGKVTLTGRILRADERRTRVTRRDDRVHLPNWGNTELW